MKDILSVNRDRLQELKVSLQEKNSHNLEKVRMQRNDTHNYFVSTGAPAY